MQVNEDDVFVNVYAGNSIPSLNDPFLKYAHKKYVY